MGCKEGGVGSQEQELGYRSQEQDLEANENI